MCGFIGIASKEKINSSNLESENKRIICRGPDETKYIKEESSDLSFELIFNRLSILELSEYGSQPLISKDKNHLLMFNGEIFNYIELKKYLEKYNIVYNSKNSDSEVLFHGLINEGHSFIDKLIGQFSIVFIDKLKKDILLIRDRTGQKPLFYTYDTKNIYFSSNLISLSKISDQKEIDNFGLEEFLNLGVVTSPSTIFQNIKKVSPGEIVNFNFSESITKKIYKYWDPLESISEKINFNEKEFDELISNSIEIRLRSDVPVAAFCSGGLDSTLIIKNLNELGSEVPTFSVVNKNPKYDERKYISLVTNKYNTKNIFKEIDSETTFENILENIENFDEPYMDASNQPSSYIAKEISSKFKVAISGDGGDEIFFGYKRFQNEFNLNKKLKHIINLIYKMYPGWLGTGNKILKFSSDYVESYSSYFEDKKFLKVLGLSDKTNFKEKYLNNSKNKFKNLMMVENRFYLSEMMNLKVDRTSMMHSLEVRSPFVDHRLFEYLLSCKTNTIHYKTSKKYVKDILKKDFNNDFLDREKMGFVFDLEKVIYDNETKIKEILNNSHLKKYIPKFDINKLFLRKSRINSQRIYKLIILSRFLEYGRF
jgi:asparagine synthase (glutamine-hydrolysing)